MKFAFRNMGLLMVFFLWLVGGGMPAGANVSAHLAGNDSSLEEDLRAVVVGLLRSEYPAAQLSNLSFDGKVLKIDFAGISQEQPPELEAFLSQIDLRVNNVLAAHQRADQRSLNYEIRLNGKLLAPNVPRPAAQQSVTGIRGKKIVLSPGHGWFDTGVDWALQRATFWGIVEDFINADLVGELNGLFKGTGADIRPTREVNRAAGNHSSGHPWWQMDGSEYVRSLGAPWSVWNAGFDGVSRDIVSRPSYANWISADLMISIHNNGGGGCGTETLYDTSNGYADQSQRFADLVQAKLIERIRTRWNSAWCDRGVKGSNGGYGENRRFDGPAVIIELGFMDDASDNAALQNATFRTIAMQAIKDATMEYFRGTYRMDDFDQDGVPDLFAIDQQGLGSISTEVNILGGASGYQSWLFRTGTLLHMTNWPGLWAFDLADYNHDGYPDLYAIDREGVGSNSTEVHILNGADGFQTWLLHTATPLHKTGQIGEWTFSLADYNGDGIVDLYAIDREGVGSNSSEVHVLNGADGFQTWLLHTGTALQRTGLSGRWAFGLADENLDGKPDLVAIDKAGQNGTSTEVHILNGADGFKTWLYQGMTALPATDAPGEWDFSLVDYNGDGRADLYAIDREGANASSTELKILDGTDHFLTVLKQTGTPLPKTGRLCEWNFGSGGDCIKAVISTPFRTYLPSVFK
jgi:N-acetylmuramoyl-L-alanine amidase